MSSSKSVKKLKIISSGQTAADRAVLEWAFETGVGYAGWYPKGECSLPEKFNLKQAPGSNPLQSGEWNVLDACGVAIISATNEFPDHLQKTIGFAQKHRRPLLHVSIESKLAAIQLRDFVDKNNISSLNVVCHQTAEGELAHLLPLILTDAFSSALTLESPDKFRRNDNSILIGANPLTIDNSSAKESAEKFWNTFQDLYVSMYRTWEGKEEYAGKVQASAISIAPDQTLGSDDFNIRASWASLTRSKPVEAARYLEMVSAEIREHPFMFWLSWSVYMATGNWQRLLETAQKNTQWRPEVAEGWALWAIALDKMGRTEEAYALLLSVLEQFQNNFTIAYNFACFACKSGRQDEAWTWVQTAFRSTDLETFKQWLLTDDDLEPLREKISELSETRLI